MTAAAVLTMLGAVMLAGLRRIQAPRPQLAVPTPAPVLKYCSGCDEYVWCPDGVLPSHTVVIDGLPPVSCGGRL